MVAGNYIVVVVAEAVAVAESVVVVVVVVVAEAEVVAESVVVVVVVVVAGAEAVVVVSSLVAVGYSKTAEGSVDWSWWKDYCMFVEAEFYFFVLYKMVVDNLC